MDFITRQQVEAATKQMIGNDAQLVNYEVKEFLGKGDTYTSPLYRIHVHANVADEKHNRTIIVKVRPPIDMPEVNTFYLETFKKEGGLYQQIAPLLSTELTLVGQVELKVPRAYHLYLNDNKEALYMEDLEEDGFKVFPRTKPFDVNKTVLVLQELARLHGASMLFKRRSSNEDLVSKFPFMKSIFSDEELATPMVNLFAGFIKGVADCAKSTEGYENVGTKIVELSQVFAKVIGQTMKCEKKFEGLIHADCFGNNFMFKYSKSGSPIRAALIDFQLTAVGSVIGDLSGVLHTCITGQLRRTHLDCFLYNYYASLSSVFASAGFQMPFTMDEMKIEFNRLKLYGLIYATFNSCVLIKAEDILEYDPKETMYEYYRQQVVKSFETRQHYRERFLDVFNEINNLN